MGTIFVILVFISRFLLILVKMIWALFAPLLILLVIIGVIRHLYKNSEKQKYYDYCKYNGISPADESSNYSDLTRENIYQERDSWL